LSATVNPLRYPASLNLGHELLFHLKFVGVF
jgi:hypothetical protein